MTNERTALEKLVKAFVEWCIEASYKDPEKAWRHRGDPKFRTGYAAALEDARNKLADLLDEMPEGEQAGEGKTCMCVACDRWGKGCEVEKELRKAEERLAGLKRDFPIVCGQRNGWQTRALKAEARKKEGRKMLWWLITHKDTNVGLAAHLTALDQQLFGEEPAPPEAGEGEPDATIRESMRAYAESGDLLSAIGGGTWTKEEIDAARAEARDVRKDLGLEQAGVESDEWLWKINAKLNSHDDWKRRALQAERERDAYLSMGKTQAESADTDIERLKMRALKAEAMWEELKAGVQKRHDGNVKLSKENPKDCYWGDYADEDDHWIAAMRKIEKESDT